MRPEQIEILCSSLRIRGHLPAPIVNGGGNRRNFLWTDGRTYGRTFFLPLILLGRLLEVDLKMFIFTVVKNLALNKRTRGPDLP